MLKHMENMSHLLEAQTKTFEKTAVLQETLCNKFYELNKEYREDLGRKIDVVGEKIDKFLVCDLNRGGGFMGDR